MTETRASFSSKKKGVYIGEYNGYQVRIVKSKPQRWTLFPGNELGRDLLKTDHDQNTVHGRSMRKLVLEHDTLHEAKHEFVRLVVEACPWLSENQLAPGLVSDAIVTSVGRRLLSTGGCENVDAILAYDAERPDHVKLDGEAEEDIRSCLYAIEDKPHFAPPRLRDLLRSDRERRDLEEVSDDQEIEVSRYFGMPLAYDVVAANCILFDPKNPVLEYDDDDQRERGYWAVARPDKSVLDDIEDIQLREYLRAETPDEEGDINLVASTEDQKILEELSAWLKATFGVRDDDIKWESDGLNLGEMVTCVYSFDAAFEKLLALWSIPDLWSPTALELHKEKWAPEDEGEAWPLPWRPKKWESVMRNTTVIVVAKDEYLMGGTDFDICETYLRCGCLPPSILAARIQETPRKRDPEVARMVLAGCRISLQTSAKRAIQQVHRIDEITPIILSELGIGEGPLTAEERERFLADYGAPK